MWERLFKFTYGHGGQGDVGYRHERTRSSGRDCRDETDSFILVGRASSTKPRLSCVAGTNQLNQSEKKRPRRDEPEGGGKTDFLLRVAGGLRVAFLRGPIIDQAHQKGLDPSELDDRGADEEAVTKSQRGLGTRLAEFERGATTDTESTGGGVLQTVWTNVRWELGAAVVAGVPAGGLRTGVRTPKMHVVRPASMLSAVDSQVRSPRVSSYYPPNARGACAMHEDTPPPRDRTSASAACGGELHVVRARWRSRVRYHPYAMRAGRECEYEYGLSSAPRDNALRSTSTSTATSLCMGRQHRASTKHNQNRSRGGGRRWMRWRERAFAASAVIARRAGVRVPVGEGEGNYPRPTDAALRPPDDVDAHARRLVEMMMGGRNGFEHAWRVEDSDPAGARGVVGVWGLLPFVCKWYDECRAEGCGCRGYSTPRRARLRAISCEPRVWSRLRGGLRVYPRCNAGPMVSPISYARCDSREWDEMQLGPEARETQLGRWAVAGAGGGCRPVLVLVKYANADASMGMCCAYGFRLDLLRVRGCRTMRAAEPGGRAPRDVPAFAFSVADDADANALALFPSASGNATLHAISASRVLRVFRAKNLGRLNDGSDGGEILLPELDLTPLLAAGGKISPPTFTFFWQTLKASMAVRYHRPQHILRASDFTAYTTTSPGTVFNWFNVKRFPSGGFCRQHQMSCSTLWQSYLTAYVVSQLAVGSFRLGQNSSGGVILPPALHLSGGVILPPVPHL
ncbi:hypothetical protein B0H14DRAFT_3606869 [Mycena olivaceomarginata]|nr:hypothetical protein B0H14DRAFT_3606869 [Mycena olivaceomarginata]